jgi:release factor glutamine methyltransferase
VAGEAQKLTEAAIVRTLRAAGCVFAEDEARLLTEAAAGQAELAAMVDRRAAGLPLEHVLGWAEFCGLRIAVDPGVFVPRRRTEFLVGEAVSFARSGHADTGQASSRLPAVIVDLCCGSGAVGVAISAALGGAEVHAVDIDPAAVECARRNLADGRAHLAGGSRVYLGDLYRPLLPELRGHVAIVAANVPYVPSGEVRLLPAEARVHEPLSAVDGGQDGLDVLRRVAGEAPQWLGPGGHLLIETSERQAAQAAVAFADAGLHAWIATTDELGATVVIGERVAPDA